MGNTPINNKEYFLTTLLICISGVNFFLGNAYLAISLLVVFTFFFNKKKVKLKFLFAYLLFIAIIFFGSAVWYSRFDYTNYISMFVRIITAFMIVSAIGTTFVNAYVKVMQWICIVGLSFWSLFVLSPSAETFFMLQVTPIFDFYLYAAKFEESAMIEAIPSPHFIVYNMNHGNSGSGFFTEPKDFLSDLSGLDRVFMRNSSCFTEPSTAMLFIIPALLFNLLITHKLFDKKNLIFALAIITSWSTGGLTVMFLVLAGWGVFHFNLSSKLVVLPAILLVAYLTFFNIENFGAEILEKVSDFQNEDLSKTKRTRFVSGFLDFQEALSHPIFGKGFYNDGVFDYFDDHRNNGTLFLLNKYGFIAFGLYFLGMFLYFRKLCIHYGTTTKFAYLMLFSIMLIGFGNKNFEKPLFIGFTMLYVVSGKALTQKASINESNQRFVQTAT